MSFEIRTTKEFDRQARRLARRYRSISEDLLRLENVLRSQPDAGVPLGKHLYKLRLRIQSKGQGQQGGGRVISYVYWRGETVFLLALYDKSEMNSVSEAYIADLLSQLDLD